MLTLNTDQIERYGRHIILDRIGDEGQQKILNAKVLIIGAGGLGSPAALYLAASGIGTIGLADNDTVHLSNLQRQVIHYTSDIDKSKVISAKEKLEQLNPDVKITPHPVRVNKDNISSLIKDYDFVLDCTDNYTSKFLINDACVKAKKPF
ncbi:ThiF family adenylyltransferase, partial [Candidatus Margulisiibacteriota bacterium]